MNRVTVGSIAVAYPEHRVTQVEAARRIGVASGDERRVAAIARGTQIESRAVAVAAEDVGRLGTIGERNAVYREVAPKLAFEAATGALTPRPDAAPIGMLVTTSCTGYMVPGWDVELVERLGLAADTVRLPITQAGCAGGVVALAHAADYLRLHPGQSALAVSVELCSLAFHPIDEAGNLTSALIFGDGAAAALLEGGSVGDGFELVEARSLLLPCSRAALGFDLTDRGFYPILTRELADVLSAPTLGAVDQMLAGHGLTPRDVGFWLVHPGGARILSRLEDAIGLDARALRWSRDSLREAGNTSSAAIFDVMRRYLADASAPKGWGVVVAFGPGISVELLLVRAC